MDSLKIIINDVFLTDIDDISRLRQTVDARKAYSKILRDIGFSFQYIADSINKNHATIMHYCRSSDSLFAYDNIFKKKFNLAKNKFLLEINNENTQANHENVFEKNKILNHFIDHLEIHVKQKGCMPNISYCRNTLLPLFTG